MGSLHHHTQNKYTGTSQFQNVAPIINYANCEGDIFWSCFNEKFLWILKITYISMLWWQLLIIMLYIKEVIYLPVIEYEPLLFLNGSKSIWMFQQKLYIMKIYFMVFE